MTAPWWTARSASERRLLVAGAVVVLATLYFLLAIEPLVAARARHVTRLNAAQALHAELGDLAGEAARLRTRGEAHARFDPAAQILAVVSASAARAGTQAYTRRITPLGPLAVSLYLDEVPFERLVGWLVTLDLEHGVEVERATLERTRAGFADAQLTLRARAGDAVAGR